jgi:hypothetical protein
MSVKPIIKMKTNSVTQELSFGRDAPLTLHSMSGTPILSCYLQATGHGHCFLTGIVDDFGERVLLSNGVVINKCCAILSMAGEMRPSKQFLQAPGENVAIVLLLEVVNSLMDKCDTAAKRNSINLKGRLCEIIIRSSNPDQSGIDEGILDITDPASIRGLNCLNISQGGLFDPNNRQAVGKRYYPAGTTVLIPKHSWSRANGEKAAKYLADTIRGWDYGKKAEMASLLATMSLFNNDEHCTKHQTGFRIGPKMAKHNELIGVLAREFEFGDPNVLQTRIMSRNQWEVVNEESAGTEEGYSRSELEAAHNSLVALKSTIMNNWDGEHPPHDARGTPRGTDCRNGRAGNSATIQTQRRL